jgi:membrane protein DedA with SNARE-associated domain
MDFFDNISRHLPLLAQYKYLILFIAGSIEGFNIFIITGFLISIGTFALVPAYFVCLAAEMVNSYFWYAVGYWGGARPIDFFVRNSNTKKRFVEKIRAYLAAYTGRVLLVMKLTYSLTIVTLIMTGGLKYNLKKFSWYNFVGSIGWVIITFSIGYFFGKGYQLYLAYFKNFSYIILFVLLGLVIIYFIRKLSGIIFIRMLLIAGRVREMSEKMREGLDKLISPHDEVE